MIDVYAYPLRALEAMLEKRKKYRVEAFKEFNKRFRRGGEEPGIDGSLVPIYPNSPNITGGYNEIKLT